MIFLLNFHVNNDVVPVTILALIHRSCIPEIQLISVQLPEYIRFCRHFRPVATPFCVRE